MRSLIQDLRYGVRSLRRSPGFALLVTVILALGVGANTAVFSIVNAVLLRPLTYHDPERIFQLDEVDPKGQPSGVAPLDLEAFAARVAPIEESALSHWVNATLTGPQGAENVYGVRVTPGLFPLFGVQPALGRGFRTDEFQANGSGVVLLSHRLWKRRFVGDASVVGTELTINGRAHVVVGIMPASFYYTQRFEFWIPAQMTAADTARRDDRWACLVRLRAGARAESARTALDSVYGNTAPDDVRRGWRVQLTSIHDQITGRSRPALVASLGAVALILLIACLNIASLLMARADDRTREIAIRAALGASRGRVFRQVLIESLLLSLVGGATGVLVGSFGAMAIVRQFPARMAIPRIEETRLDAGVLLFALAITLLTGLLFGLLPAWTAARQDLNLTLKQGGRCAGPRSLRFRSGLVIAETGLSFALLIGAGLLLRSFTRLIAVDPGFNPDRVLTLRVPLPAAITARGQQAPHYTRLLEQLQHVPGLKAVGLITPLPLTGLDASATFSVEGRPAASGEQQLVKLRAASPGYFRAMGVSLRQGRFFEESDEAGAPAVALINESLVRHYFPHANPIGKRVSMRNDGTGPLMTIVGVVRDTKSLNLAAKVEPELYRDYRQFTFAPFANTIVVRTEGADPLTVAAAVQQRIRAANPDQPIVDVLAMQAIVSGSVAQPRFYTFLLGLLATIGLLLAASGLYGLLSHSVGQQVREIGIRAALGASRLRILSEILRSACALLAAGIALGLALGFALTRLLETQFYQTNPTDPLTYAAVSLLLLAVGLFAAWIPARRAMGVDPNIALRAD